MSLLQKVRYGCAAVLIGLWLLPAGAAPPPPESPPDGLVVEWAPPRPDFRPLPDGSVELVAEGYEIDGRPGALRLPFTSALVAIPPGTSPTLRVLSAQTTVIPLPAPLAVAPEPVGVIRDEDGHPVGPAFASAPRTLPPPPVPVVLEEVGTVRGVRLARVTFYPALPERDRLQFYQHIRVEIRFSGEKRSGLTGDDPILARVRRAVLNPQDALVAQDLSRPVAQDSSCSPQDKSRATADVAQDSSCPAARDISRRETAWLLLLPLLVTAMVLLVERFQPPPLYERRLTETGLRNVPIPAHIVYDGQFHLLGWEPILASSPADQAVSVWLYWWDTVPGGPDYRVWLGLKEEEETWNHFWVPPATFRTAPSSRVWPPDQYAIIAQNVFPIPGTPPGEYTVTLTVFDGETLLPYTAVEDGRALGPEISLAQVQLTRPSAAPSLETLGIPVTATMPVWGPIRLLKGTVREQESRPGDPLHLEFYWESLADPDGDYRMRLWFSGEGGREWERPLTRADFPTSQWRAGDRWLGLHTLRLPPGLESEEHELWLQLCRRDGEACHPIGEPHPLGSLRVQAPPRSWTVPPLEVRTDARLGDEVTLVGADWEPRGETLQPGATLTVTLVWQGEREMETSYRVFLHLLGPDGSLVAQSDGEPAGWTRPTTGWVPGEVVVDERVLSLPAALPPGEYRLTVGMYRYGGPRLLTPDGTDTLLLMCFQVE